MIIEAALVAATVVVAGAVTRAMMARRGRRRREPQPVIQQARGLKVGDVLLHVGESFWLAGVVDLEEEGSKLRLFRAVEGSGMGWIAQLDEEARELLKLRETSEVPEGVVPDRLPIEGRVLSLVRRAKVRASVEGDSLPSTAARASLTMLADAGGRSLVVVEFEGAPRLTLIGDQLDRALVELLPGGDAER